MFPSVPTVNVQQTSSLRHTSCNTSEMNNFVKLILCSYQIDFSSNEVNLRLTQECHHLFYVNNPLLNYKNSTLTTFINFLFKYLEFNRLIIDISAIKYLKAFDYIYFKIQFAFLGRNLCPFILGLHSQRMQATCK